MVDHLVVAPELWVFIGQRVEAVGALGDDLLHTHGVELFDILAGQHLEEIFVAGAPSGVARAGLGWPEDGVIDTGPFEKLSHRPADLLVFVVERPRATDPVEVFGVERVAAFDDLHAVEIADPVGPLGLAHAPRVRGIFHRPICLPEF